jgi:hypothetical protein
VSPIDFSPIYFANPLQGYWLMKSGVDEITSHLFWSIFQWNNKLAFICFKSKLLNDSYSGKLKDIKGLFSIQFILSFARILVNVMPGN